MKKFTHLHVHTEFSLLDAVTRIPGLAQKVKEMGMEACAITDHGNLYGAFKFHKAMKSEDLKPIIGVEMYIAPRSHHEKESGIDNKYFHLTILAKNKEGYRNISKLVSIANMEGFYYKPRVDIETLTKYSEGLICLSGCLSGYLPAPIKNGDPKKARVHAKTLHDIFGEDFYVEIQKNGIELQDTVNEELLKIAAEMDLPIVATSDIHYLNRSEHEVQEIVWAIADGKTWDDPSRRKLDSHEFYVKSPEEMIELFKDLPEAIDNTQKIVEKIEEYDIGYDRVEPKYKHLPDGKDAKEFLKDLAYEGVKKKYGKFTKKLKERTDYELSVIDDKGYNDYFLIVYQIVDFCRENGIVVSMRGSGTGSIVAYGIDITSIDPIAWQLYFERFLNPERKSAPDFDIDLEDSRRHEVIKFVQEEFGEENVRQIITFSKLQTRQAIRDVGRVLEIDPVITDKLSKMVEIVFGKAKPIDYMIENNSEFKEIIESGPGTLRLAELVRKLAGQARGVSTHACGVLITPKPVTEYVAIQRDTHNEGIGIAQFEFEELEDIGLMKFDFLGLRNLGIVGSTLKKLKSSRGLEIDLNEIDYTDKKAFAVINKLETVGIFQMESEGMKKTIKDIKPDSVEELCYLVAAYRPGPMQFIPEYTAVKRGEKEPHYLFPDLEPILSITNGVVTYQEQVIRIAVDIGGYTMGAADILRKAMGKKKMEVMEAERPVFLKGALKNGYKEQDILDLWDLLVKFANYGFNKAHSAMYATVAFWTAYLKGNYPLEFMASLLESDLENFDRVSLDLRECARLGITVLPPSINESGAYFTIGKDGEESIRFGLGAVKNIGPEIVKLIVKEREENGLYESFDEFVYRNISKVQKRVIEYLIQVGAFDEFGDRGALIQILPKLHDGFKKQKKIEEQGQLDIFSAGGEGTTASKIEQSPIPIDIETPMHQMLEWEKELLGLYFSSHPLDNLQEFFESKDVVPVSSLADTSTRKLVTLGVLITEVKRITTKKGDRMAFLTAEDKSKEIDIIVFPTKYEEVKDIFEPNKPMLIAGRVNKRDGELSVIFEKGMYIDQEKFGDNFTGVIFRINDKHSDEEVAKLKKYIRANKGDTPVRILMNTDGELKSINLEHKITVNSETKKLLNQFS